MEGGQRFNSSAAVEFAVLVLGLLITILPQRGIVEWCRYDVREYCLVEKSVLTVSRECGRRCKRRDYDLSIKEGRQKVMVLAGGGT